MKFQYEREDGVVTTTNMWYSAGLDVWRWTCTNESVVPYRQYSGEGREFSECYEDVLECIVNI